ncbi:hypothetical protein ACQP2K_17115 [Microbispora siamensis]
MTLTTLGVSASSTTPTASAGPYKGDVPQGGWQQPDLGDLGY